MKRFTQFTLALAVTVLLGCDKASDPVSFNENQQAQTVSESVEKFRKQIAEAKPRFEQALVARRAQAAQYLAQHPQPKNYPNVIAGATIRVPDDYTSIQAAIDAATPGTKVLVKSGTYTENLSITTPKLRLTGSGTVNLIGSIHVFGTTGVQIDHFNFSGAFEFSVLVETCSKVEVKDNTFSAAGLAGLAFVNSTKCNAKKNNFSNSIVGAAIEGGSGNTLDENTGTGSQGAFALGVLLATTTGNTLSGNSASSNLFGIAIGEADNNTLKGNVCNGNIVGIINFAGNSNEIGSKNTASFNSDYGILLESTTTGNKVTKNTARNNGICDINNFGSGNTASKNTAGCTSGF